MSTVLQAEHPQVRQVEKTLASLSHEQAVERVRNAGIVGAGGAGFPTYVKLQSKAEIYLVNGAECEPLLRVDQQLMADHPEKLVRGLLYSMKLTGATKGIIALKAKYKAAIAALEPLLPPSLELHILKDVYPAGDEVVTIRSATGRVVPAGQLPISIGVVVNNVQTLIHVAEALEQEKPVTHRSITVGGAVAKPGTFVLPLGTPLSQVLALAGGPTVADPAYLLGGPMMGPLCTDLSAPLTKTASGLLVLPSDHILIKRRTQSLESVLAMGRTVCEQCQMCTELCPRHLLGHELAPHKLVKAAAYGKMATPSVLLSALTCSECGLCEAYACPVEISPMRINRMYKQQLREQGARYEGELRPVDPMADYRMIPTKRLISRLQLEQYNTDAPMTQANWNPERVSIPLSQHIGAPAKACVSSGDRVHEGQMIAQPDGTNLSVAIHASISGVVTEVSASQIVISRG